MWHLWSGQLCGSLECHFQVWVGKKRLYSLSFQLAYLEENRHQRCWYIIWPGDKTNNLSLSRLSFLARIHATYRTCFLKPRRMLSIFFNPGKIWSLMARTFATPTEQDHEPVFFLFFRLRGKGNAISSVIYRKKTKHSNISMFVRKKEKDELQGSHKVFSNLAVRDRIFPSIGDEHVNYWSKSFYNCTCAWCISPADWLVSLKK